MSSNWSLDDKPCNEGISGLNCKVTKVVSCNLHRERHVSEDTALYKYLSIEGFLFLLEYRQLMFSRVTQWPDAYEGNRFEFFKTIKKDNPLSDKTKSDFYGSCWSLQTEPRSLYKHVSDYENAVHELRKDGSASMWEAYCPRGGVRIRTTIAKINSALELNLTNCKVFRGKVFYEPATSWSKTMKTKDLISLLLMKRIPFRHESEYRFIVVPDHSPTTFTNLPIPIGNWFDFVDEILVSPCTVKNKWISRTIYNMAIRASINAGNTCINTKDSVQYCRISQLYGNVTETVGNHE